MRYLISQDLFGMHHSTPLHATWKIENMLRSDGAQEVVRFDELYRYGWFFVDALMLMVLAVAYLLLTRVQSPLREPTKVATTAGGKKHEK